MSNLKSWIFHSPLIWALRLLFEDIPDNEIKGISWKGLGNNIIQYPYKFELNWYLWDFPYVWILIDGLFIIWQTTQNLLKISNLPIALSYLLTTRRQGQSDPESSGLSWFLPIIILITANDIDMKLYLTIRCLKFLM